MKRRISKRRVKIIMARELRYVNEKMQFEPDDHHTRKARSIYIRCAQITLNERVFPWYAKL